MSTATPSASRSRVLLVRAGVALVFLALVVAALGLRTQASRTRDRWPPEADTFYLPSSRLLKLLAFGHSELGADLIHARANVYFGTQLHARMPTQWLGKYLDTALDLDPQFQRLYVSGSAMLVYNGQRITPPMVLEANRILERGRKAFPFDWEIAFQLGFNLMFELPNDADEGDARIPGWRQQGVEVMREAALLEGVPPYIPNLVARMLTRQGSQDLAVKHLEQAYAVAASDTARDQIRYKLTQLRGRQMSDGLEDMLRQYRQIIGSGFAQVPEAFTLVVGPRSTSNAIVAAAQKDKKSP
jgi:hypothetical protein